MNQIDATVLSLHLLATGAMVGLIWFVQIVHYQLFPLVDESRFTIYEQAHQRQTSWVVGPLMGLEVASAAVMAVSPPLGISRWWPVLGLAMLGVIHASTIWLQVPEHRRLSGGFDHRHWVRLWRSNWVRTVGWTGRGVLAMGMVIGAMAR